MRSRHRQRASRYRLACCWGHSMEKTTSAPVDDLAARAAAIDAGVIGGTAAPIATPEQQQSDQQAEAIAASAKEARGYLDTLAALAEEAGIKQVAELLTPDRRDKIAQAFGAVAVKRGWTMGVLFTRWKEEADLVEACMPLIVYAGTLAWQSYRNKGKPALPTPAPAAPAAPATPPAPAPEKTTSKKKPTFVINGEPVA